MESLYISDKNKERLEKAFQFNFSIPKLTGSEETQLFQFPETIALQRRINTVVNSICYSYAIMSWEMEQDLLQSAKREFLKRLRNFLLETKHKRGRGESRPILHVIDIPPELKTAKKNIAHNKVQQLIRLAIFVHNCHRQVIETFAQQTPFFVIRHETRDTFISDLVHICCNPNEYILWQSVMERLIAILYYNHDFLRY